MEVESRPLRKITELDDNLEDDVPVPSPPSRWKDRLLFVFKHLIYALVLTKVSIIQTGEWLLPRLKSIVAKGSSKAVLFVLYCLLSMACERLGTELHNTSNSRRY